MKQTLLFLSFLASPSLWAQEINHSATAIKEDSESKSMMTTACTDKINYVGSVLGLATQLGPYGPAGNGVKTYYQAFPTFTGQVSRVDFTAAKIGVNTTVQIGIWASDGTSYPLPTGPLLGSVNVTVNGGIAEYGANFASPVNVTSGFVVGISAIGVNDSINIYKSPDNSDFSNLASFDDYVGSGPFNWYEDLDWLIRPTIKFTLPTMNFTATPTPACVGANVAFDNTYTGSFPNNFLVDMYNPYPHYTETYNYGDGTTITPSSSPEYHAYATAGTKTATYSFVYLGSTTNCPITLTKTVVVNPATTSSFTTSTSGLNLTVVNTSVDATSWSWNFGDLTTSSLQNPPVHTYASAGTYIVELNTSGPCGTSIITSHTITVAPAGINEVANIGRLTYYPNPASSTLTLDYEIVNGGNKTTIDIVNTLGQIIRSENIGGSTNGIITVDISNLTAGTYFIKFSNEKGNLVRHFIKE